ncbi:vWA domain-containing protein [Roseimaritima ulvae]|uniref:von Willebrand factor type A domain protein n=1 Tax=Roseimaritima ulvae TaxID=980254 RepID=A0A5B9QPQ2_9BACT|nr:vWA domain-containing protein [Roseimaritima ulvae]QEG39899.1 von Willebrand factor type A domain protein [Roseimaritima ulvae]
MPRLPQATPLRSPHHGNTRRGTVRRRRRGAMLVLLAVAMVLFMVTAALAIDIARMHLARTELRTATDAAAKAAAEALSRTQDADAAIARGTEIAADNDVNGSPLLLRQGDFEFGRSEENTTTGRFVMNTAGRPLNSVRVRGERTNTSASGPIPLMFGNVFNRDFFEARQQAVATYIERDVVLVVDRSGSMRGSKFADLRSAIDEFIDTLNATPVDEQVGLASYSDRASADVALTGNLSRISDKMQELRASGLTSISRGMTAGESIISAGRSRDFVERTMIVMTDGNHNRGPEPRTVATSLAAEGVVIHTITFGRDADKPRMREVAQIGRGRHFHADNGLELRDIYREIALTLSTMITE